MFLVLKEGDQIYLIELQALLSESKPKYFTIEIRWYQLIKPFQLYKYIYIICSKYGLKLSLLVYMLNI